MEGLSSEVLQYGAFGLCLVLIGYTYAKDKIFNWTINNHLDHLNNTLNKLNEILGSNNEIIKENTKILNRILGKFDK